MQKTCIMEINEQSLASFEEREKYTVCVVGCGKMGLPTACLFADVGFNVIGVDKNIRIVETLRKGKSPFLEPGLDDIIAKNVKAGRLRATDKIGWAVSQSDVVLIVVDTPVDEEKKQPDYSRLETACKDVGKNLQKGSSTCGACIQTRYGYAFCGLRYILWRSLRWNESYSCRFC